jgi:hypothetical protein
MEAGIDVVILLPQQAFNLAFDRDENKYCLLVDIGKPYKSHFECSDNATDINHAISLIQQTLELIPTNPSIEMSLFTIWRPPSPHFRRLRDVADTDQAISFFEQDVDSFTSYIKDKDDLPSMAWKDLTVSFHI